MFHSCFIRGLTAVYDPFHVPASPLSAPAVGWSPAFVLAWMCAVSAADGTQLRVDLLGNESLAGRLTSWSDGQLTLDRNGQAAVIDVRRLRRVHVLDPPVMPVQRDRQITVRFANDDLLKCDDVRVENDLLTLHREGSGSLEFPLSSVAGLQFDIDPAEHPFGLPRGDPPVGDSVWLTSGQRVPGEFQSLDREGVELKSVLGPLRIEHARLRRIDFDPELLVPGAEASEFLLVTLADGSFVTALDLSVSAEGLWTIDLPSNSELRLQDGDIRRIDRYAPEVVSLAGLTPARSTHRNYFGTAFAPLANRNVLGRTMLIQGLAFGRGWGTSSRSTIVFAVPPDSREFSTGFGLDDTAGEQGAVAASVLVDGRPRWSQAVITRDGGLIEIGPLDLRGAAELTLHVDFGPRGDVGDVANWVDPVILTGPP